MPSPQQLFLHHVVLKIGAGEEAPSEILDELFVASYNLGRYRLKIVKLVHCGTYTKT